MSETQHLWSSDWPTVASGSEVATDVAAAAAWAAVEAAKRSTRIVLVAGVAPAAAVDSTPCCVLQL